MSNVAAEIKSKKRVLWIDYAKCLGIILIVSAHQSANRVWFDFISAFIIPMFFFLSGFLFSFKKFDTYSQFLKARTKQLLVPYFLLNFVAYFIWLFFFRHFDQAFVTQAPWYNPFIGIFYGNGYGYHLVHCVPSWFIICLFSLENIYFLVFRNLKRTYSYIALFSFLLLCWAENYHYRLWLPWGVDIAFVGIIFYGVANIFKNKIIQFLELSLPKLFAIFVVAVTVLIFVSSRSHADMNQHEYQDMRLFFVGAFVGIIFLITLCRIIELLFGRISIFEFFAQNTLFIMAFHLMVVSLVTKFIIVVFHVKIEKITANPLIGLVVVIPTLLLLIPLVNLCNKYFPVMVGRPAKLVKTTGLSKAEAVI